NPQLRWLVDAIRRLVNDELPAGASLLKVFAAGQVYLLRRQVTADGELEIHLTNLFDPVEQVVLSRTLAELVAALGEEALRRQSVHTIAMCAEDEEASSRSFTTCTTWGE